MYNVWNLNLFWRCLLGIDLTLLNANDRTCQHQTFLPKGTGEEEIQVTYFGNKKLYS